MSRDYLYRFVFAWDATAPFIQRRPSGLSTKEGQQLINEIEHARTRFLAWDMFIDRSLKRSKIRIGKPPITWTRVMLTTDPKPKPYFDPEPFLNVDVNYDPRDLPKLPMDREYIGELAIRLANEALDKLKDFPGFPCETIREACEEFRAHRYGLRLKAGEKMIPGTRIKGRIDVAISGVSTTRTFTALYRNKPLFSKKISEEDGGEIIVSTRFSGFEFENGVITVPGDQYNPFPEGEGPDWLKPVSIDLRDYPETFEFMREKGWVT